MASHPQLIENTGLPPFADLRVYTVCFFDPGQLVPRVKLFDASSDDEAIAEARSMNPWTRRELWDRHRLVATIGSRAMA